MGSYYFMSFIFIFIFLVHFRNLILVKTTPYGTEKCMFCHVLRKRDFQSLLLENHNHLNNANGMSGYGSEPERNLTLNTRNFPSINIDATSTSEHSSAFSFIKNDLRPMFLPGGKHVKVQQPSICILGDESYVLKSY